MLAGSIVPDSQCSGLPLQAKLVFGDAGLRIQSLQQLPRFRLQHADDVQRELSINEQYALQSFRVRYDDWMRRVREHRLHPTQLFRFGRVIRKQYSEILEIVNRA